MTLAPFLVRSHAIKFSMRCVLVRENQLVEQAIHIWIEQAGIVGCRYESLSDRRLNGPGHQFLDLSREVLEEPLNDRAVPSLVRWAKHEIDSVVGSVA